jgi:uncharacterized protein Yka (UPF0111/DUF47 family)
MSLADRWLGPLARRMVPRSPDFGALLDAQCAVVEEGLGAVVGFLGGAGADGELVARLEKEGDRRRARTLEALSRAFTTPYDREDVHAAATTVDDILNYAKTTVREVQLLGVEPDDAMRAIAAELHAGAGSLRRGFAALGRDAAAAAREGQAVHKAERNAEKRYRAAVAELLAPERYRALLAADGADATAEAFAALLDALRRREVLRHLSNAADRLDAAGRTLLGIAVEAV